MMKRPFAGVWVAAITPHGQQSHEIDVGAAFELIDFLCAAGVQGIALLGSTGEFLNLKFNDRIRLVHLAAKRCSVPLLAGVAHSTLDGALELGREACQAGVAGLLLMPPYFFRYSQADIREFFLRFAAQMGPNIPIFLYNIPFFTNEITRETALDLLSTGLFAGIKDSSGQFDYFLCLKEFSEKQPFTLLVGNDAIFTRARMAGAHGVISGVACVVPELLLGLDRAIQGGATARIERLEARLQEFLARLDRLPVPIGIKVAAGVRGIEAGPLTIPLSPTTLQTAEEFREWFRAWLPVVKRESANG